MARFLIRNPKTGEEYALDSLTDFRKKRGPAGQSYEDRGFTIPDEQPHGWTAPKSAPLKKKSTKNSDGENTPPDQDGDGEPSNNDGDGEDKG